MDKPTESQIIEIAETAGALGTLWAKYFAPLRLGQLMVCLQSHYQDDLFYKSNEEIMQMLEEYGKAVVVFREE